MRRRVREYPLRVSNWAVHPAFLATVLFSAALIFADGVPERAARFRKDIRPLLSTYCFDCHGDGAKKGKVSFDEFKTDEALLDPVLWNKALKNLRAGIMPPAGKDRPTTDELKVIEHWIKRDAFAIDPNNPDPGRVVLRRLNRTEYRNTIRDLMGYDFDTAAAFPPDDTGQGFDNIASVQSVSPMLLDKYMQAADTIVRAVVPDVTKVVQRRVLTGRDFVPGATVRGPENRDNPADARVNIGVAAKYPAKIHIDEPGEYRITAHFGVYGQFGYDPSRANISFELDGEQVYKKPHVWEDEKHGKQMTLEYARRWEPGDKEFVFEVEPLPKVGSEAATLTVPQTQASNRAQVAGAAQQAADPNSQDAAATAQGRGRRPTAAGAIGGARRGRGPRGTTISLSISYVSIEGPLDKAHWVHPPHYDRYFTKDEPPVDPDQRRQYAREVLKPFATRALRRPIDARTLDRLVSLAESTYTDSQKTFEQGIQQAMIAVLSSPRFLFRVEETVAPSAGQLASPLDEYALASRLSYLLWNSMPDDELFKLAQRGELRKELDAQVKRMLADPRSEAMVESFAGQWLRTREVDTVAIDDRAVLARDAGTEAQMRADDQAAAAAAAARRGGRGQPAAGPTAGGPRGRGAFGAAPGAFGGRRRSSGFALDRELRTAMRQETEMYFGHIVHEDRSVLELIDSNYTFLNERLARHYGIPNVTGPEMRKVELPDGSHRGGILTQGSILTITSQSTRTSAVKRGLFLLENILGAPAPPPPPPGTPALEVSEKSFQGKEPTLREALELHRNNAVCQSCHARMDPLGLALENYNALGLWRTKERGQDIVVEGKLITGEKLASVDDLRKVLTGERRADFYRCLTQKFMIYALGRDLEYYDVDAVDQIVDRLDKENGKFSALLMGVIQSAPFQKRRNIVAPLADAPRPRAQAVAKQ